jgi:hypothetical protein
VQLIYDPDDAEDCPEQVRGEGGSHRHTRYCKWCDTHTAPCTWTTVLAQQCQPTRMQNQANHLQCVVPLLLSAADGCSVWHTGAAAAYVLPQVETEKAHAGFAASHVPTMLKPACSGACASLLVPAASDVQLPVSHPSCPTCTLIPCTRLPSPALRLSLATIDATRYLHSAYLLGLYEHSGLATQLATLELATVVLDSDHILGIFATLSALTSLKVGCAQLKPATQLPCVISAVHH